MTDSELQTSPSWVPASCSLPTAEQPLRLAEFDEFFATSVTGVEFVPQGLRLQLIPDAQIAARAAELTARETQCCSFFTFTVTASGGGLTLDISAPADRAGVLAAIATRAAAAR